MVFDEPAVPLAVGGRFTEGFEVGIFDEPAVLLPLVSAFAERFGVPVFDLPAISGEEFHWYQCHKYEEQRVGRFHFKSPSRVEYGAVSNLFSSIQQILTMAIDDMRYAERKIDLL